jgi:hypothetical protein
VYGSAATFQNPTLAASTTPRPTTSGGQFGGPDNLLMNASFETGFAAPWTSATASSALGVTALPTPFGSNVLLVQATKPSSPPPLLGAQVVVVQNPARGSRYEFECWVMGSPMPSSKLVIELAAQPAHGRWTLAGISRQRVPARWRRFSVRGRVPPGKFESLHAIVYVAPSIPAFGWFALDGVIAKRVPGAGSAGRP